MTEDTSTDSPWLLILTQWPDDERGFPRPVLEQADDREDIEDRRHEYAKNDALCPSDYTVVRRDKVHTLEYEVSFDDYNDRTAETTESYHAPEIDGQVRYCPYCGEPRVAGSSFRDGTEYVRRGDEDVKVCAYVGQGDTVPEGRRMLYFHELTS